jgi:putative ABC transport system permease protein
MKKFCLFVEECKLLKLKNITKHYVTGNSTVEALRGVSLEFRKNEFVSILGQSGCGKTTLLNIIGGLDRYTDGDLIINGKSTKTFDDGDWDSYRNHSIGFVFQSYNLIPHQTVLANVELALTLSGVSKAERRRRATEALVAVGLGDQIHKRPNQMSGGQMQRVAIARALVNDPDILLADEPTGALDTSTSVQIMEILKEISRDRLIIMVTHNPELAETYSSRIIKVLDGLVIGDSNPYHTPNAPTESAATELTKKELRKKKRAQKAAKKKAKTSMSFFTALSLSLNNLATKKGRTAMTSFAGSIGIIGIAMILALSSGINLFIDDIQKDTLSSFPITIYEKDTDLSALMENLSGAGKGEGSQHDQDAVYSNPMLYDLIHSMNSATEKTNNLEKFKKYLDDRDNNSIGQYISAVEYTYNIDLNMYTQDGEGNYNKADVASLFSAMMGDSPMGSSSSNIASSFVTLDTWCQILPGQKNDKGEYTSLVSDMITEQYDVVYGEWPDAANEVVLVMSSNNEVTDMTLYALGLISKDDIIETITAAMKGDETYESEVRRFTYEDICNVKYKMILNADYYEKDKESNLWKDVSDNDLAMKLKIENGYDVKIVGIIKPNANATSTILSGSLAYTAALTEHVITETLNTELAKEQLDEKNSNIDVFTGLNFVAEKDLTESEKVETLRDYAKKSRDAVKAQLYFDIMCTPTQDEIDARMKMYKDQFFADGEQNDYRDMLSNLILSQNLIEGMDEETLKSFLDAYSDEELEEMVDEYLLEMVETSLYDEKKAVIVDQISAPSQETLQMFKKQIADAILATEIQPGVTMTKQMYVAYTYSQMTGVSPETYIGMMFAGTIDAEAAFDKLVTEQALKTYAEKVTVSQEQIDVAAAIMLDELISSSTDEELLDIYENYLPDGLSENTYEDNLRMIGVCNLDKPSAVNIYAVSFENKDAIAEEIKKYNSTLPEEDQISYTDYVALLMTSVTTIINVISYVLIGFVSVSLVVSSIMIGIITNISVLERTKEIGILRAIGASKKDVSRVFNAETVIIGFCAGLLGVVVTALLCLPISAILRQITGFNNITAYVPLPAGIALVLISVLLTLIAGIIPARAAAKKDPVIALRSE